MNDKFLEKDRYDDRAESLIAGEDYQSATKIPLYFQPPIKFYESLFDKIPPRSKVLEIGAGVGENTQFLLERGFEVYATDISPKSVKFLKDRFSNQSLFTAEVADMESLPFSDNSFDLVCSAGSLSYGDNHIVMNQIYRVLNKGGAFIAIDSLNENPIYKFNRYLHFLKGNRSKSTLKRMPTIKLIESYIQKFGYAEVEYFGSISWLFPLLKIFMTDENLGELSNRFDKKINIKRSAFKFTIKAIKT